MKGPRKNSVPVEKRTILESNVCEASHLTTLTHTDTHTLVQNRLGALND